eukprot:scaffold224203_cov21-Prasinocladus_malaysianus.AAC.1
MMCISLDDFRNAGEVMPNNAIGHCLDHYIYVEGRKLQCHTMLAATCHSSTQQQAHHASIISIFIWVQVQYLYHCIFRLEWSKHVFHRADDVSHIGCTHSFHHDGNAQWMLAMDITILNH